MPDLELWLVGLTLAGLALGAWGICWARSGSRTRGSVGRGLLVGSLLLLGATALVAAGQRAGGLVPLGLSAGWLVSAMLWEAPGPAEQAGEVAPLPEQIEMPAGQVPRGPSLSSLPVRTRRGNRFDLLA